MTVAWLRLPQNLARIKTAGLRPVDIASLATFRIIFGLVMFGGTLRFLSTGWITPLYGEPRWFFTYPGFAWVHPWSVTGMYIHYSVLAVLALAIALGAYTRLACALFTVGFAYTQLIDVTNYLNHHYLVVLLGGLLTFLPSNHYWSVDVWRRPTLRRMTVPAWMVWLVRFQVGLVYVFAGLAKAKMDWLGHAQPLNIWLSARTHIPVIGELLDEPVAARFMSWAGFLFDTTIVMWLSWRRTRLPAYLTLLLFHGATGYLFNIGMFPIIMSSAALIFFPYSWPRWPSRGATLATPTVAVDAVPRDASLAEPARPRSTLAQRLLVGVIGCYMVFQIALPLRHLVYPGNVLWNEDGMRFAWHVMVREKHGEVMFVARFRDGKQLRVPPGHYLTSRQEREMAGQPDLILQLARHIGADLHAKGYRGFVLHAETAISLNGRSPATMIDPNVDLLEITDVGPRWWVLPEPVAAPPMLRPM
ncbi:MAG: HTTM domain-containing protein [Kofleriaceae bacterium]|nr:HTTM domain-containing protein [Kofleriaceae bacterium]